MQAVFFVNPPHILFLHLQLIQIFAVPDLQPEPGVNVLPRPSG